VQTLKVSFPTEVILVLIPAVAPQDSFLPTGLWPGLMGQYGGGRGHVDGLGEEL